MKAIYTFLSLYLLVATATFAQTDTDELLGAPNVKSYIQLWPDFDKRTFLYSLDADNTRKQYKSLSACPTVGVPRRQREVTLTIRFYNPLQYTIRTTDTLLIDPAYESIGKFASSLTNFIRQLPTVNESSKDELKKDKKNEDKTDKSDDAALISTPDGLSTYTLKSAGLFTPASVSVTNVTSASAIKFVNTNLTETGSKTLAAAMQSVTSLINDLAYSDLAEWKYAFMQGRLACIDTSMLLIRRFKLLDDRYYNGNFRITILKGMDRLSKPDNIKSFRDENKVFSREIDSLSRVNTQNKQLINSFNDDISGDLQKVLLNKTIPTEEANTDRQLCTAFITYSQIVFKRFVRACLDGQRRRDQVLEMAKRLSEEISSVEKDVDQTFGDDDGGYHPQNAIILGRYSIQDEHLHKVGILIRRRAINYDADPPVLVETNERLYGKINIRSSQTLIPEYSIGVYFSNITYPVYGLKVLTADQARTFNEEVAKGNPAFPKPGSTSYNVGQTVVDEVVNQQLPVVAAAMLNLTLNAFNGLAHPFMQVGVGTGKTLPTFLAGGGIRLRWKVPIMLSAGAIWNWKRQFTALRVNDVVEGQARLENDLQTVFDPKPRFYLGFQLHM